MLYIHEMKTPLYKEWNLPSLKTKRKKQKKKKRKEEWNLPKDRKPLKGAMVEKSATCIWSKRERAYESNQRDRKEEKLVWGRNELYTYLPASMRIFDVPEAVTCRMRMLVLRLPFLFPTSAAFVHTYYFFILFITITFVITTKEAIIQFKN